jgi:hypothetical protein
MEGWRAILEQLRARDPAVASVLGHAVPLAVTPDSVELGFEQGSFYEAQARQTATIDLLTRVVRQHFGKPTSVAFVVHGPANGTRATAYEIEEAERAERVARARGEVERHPLVQAAVRELGARIQDVKLASKG